MINKVLKYTISQLVDKCDDLTIHESRGKDKVTVTITVAPDDLKRVIGKEGRVIRAIRSVVQSYAHGVESEVILESHPA